MYLLLIALAFLQPVENDSVKFTNSVIISSDFANTPHAEPHLSINPRDPSELLLGAVVLPDSTHHRIDAFRSNDGGKNWDREYLPIMPDSVSSIDPWTSFDRKGNSYISVLTPITYYEEVIDLGFKLLKKSLPTQNGRTNILMF